MAPIPSRRQDYGQPVSRVDPRLPKVLMPAGKLGRQINESSPQYVQALRTFLINQGYSLAPKGNKIGPELASALKNWSSGVKHRNPAAWSKAHPLPIHKANPIAADGFIPKHNVAPNSSTGHTHGGNSGGGGGNSPIDFSSMLAGLLGKSNTSKMLPLSLADQAASPYTSQAATFADQISRLPAAKKQALQNLSDWFGQVQKAEKHGAAQDQSLANAGAASMQDATKGIMASLGGSAMAGSGEVGAVGANDANTMSAIGANDASLANELAPIFKLSEASAKNTRSQQYDNQLSDLQDQQGQAQGQADAARAAAVQAILQANNQSRQTNFGNASGLLNTLAGLQISGANAASQAQSRQIENALRISEINKNAQKSSGNPLDAMTPSQRAAFADKITQGITSGKLSWPDALRAARNSARTAGLNPFGNQVIQSIIGPALANAGITGPGGGFWPAVYKR